MMQRLTRLEWLLSAITITVFLAGCKNGGSGGGGY
jgi:hypothetical protein